MDNIYYDHVSAEDKIKDRFFESIVECSELFKEIDVRMMYNENPIKAKKLFKASVMSLFRFAKPYMIEFIKSMETETNESNINDREAIKEVLDNGNKYDTMGTKKMKVRMAKDLFEWLGYFCEIYGLTRIKKPKAVM